MISTKALFGGLEGSDERSLEFITKAIEKNNLPGFDFFEFKRAIVTLQEMQIEEGTAHKSAFHTAATLGVTKEKLIETANYYKNVVEKEREAFANALEAQNENKIVKKQTDITRLRDQIDRHKAEITRLQDEIAKYLDEVEGQEATIHAESQKLATAKTAFEFTHKAVLLALDKDIENMNKYL